MPWKVFAEDEGTGLQSQDDADYGDGAHLNALAHNPNATNFAVVAPTLTYDSSVPDVTLGEAQYRVTATNVEERDHDNDNTVVVWPEVTFTVKAPSVTKSLTDSTTNYIFVDLDLTTSGDDAQYVVKTSNSPPTSPSLLVATIDTSNDTAQTENINPSVSAATVSAEQADIATLEADTELNGPTASEGDVVTLPSNPDVVPIFFDAQTGQPLVPDLEETI